MKVAFLTNIVSPYRAPVFQSLAQTPGWDLSVVVNARSEFDRKWSGDCKGVRVIESRSIARKIVHVVEEPVRVEQVTTRFVPIGLLGDLYKIRPDVVISHELGPRSMLAAAWCRLHRKPLVLWSYQARTSAGRHDGRIRRKVRDFVFRTADSVLGMGVQARDVLESTGCPPEKILDAPNSTDENLVLNSLRSAQQSGTIERLRAEYGEGKKIAVAVGRLIPLKGPLELLNAWKALPADLRDQWRLVFVGDGPLRSFVQDAAELGVRHVPEVPMHDVPHYMGMADLHVFASFADVWGLTVNEAMLSGLPTLCSTLAGCSDDTVRDGVDGYLFDPRTEESFIAGLEKAMRCGRLAEMGVAAAEAGRQFTVERLAEGFRRAVDQALAHRRPGLAVARS